MGTTEVTRGRHAITSPCLDTNKIGWLILSWPLWITLNRAFQIEQSCATCSPPLSTTNRFQNVKVGAELAFLNAGSSSDLQPMSRPRRKSRHTLIIIPVLNYPLARNSRKWRPKCEQPGHFTVNTASKFMNSKSSINNYYISKPHISNAGSESLTDYKETPDPSRTNPKHRPTHPTTLNNTNTRVHYHNDRLR